MANINLNNRFRRTNEQYSPLDSSLVIKRNKTDEELYSDIRFDFRIDDITDRYYGSKELSKDLAKITDANSVITSLKNLFETLGGQRILNPEISLDLRRFLFEPINSFTAYFIGVELRNLIPAYEPRVELQNIDITGYPDEGFYDISFKITIPTLDNRVLNVQSKLSK